jgi:hypothetical protein
MKYICILILSVLISGCDNQDNQAQLKVNMTRTSGHDALNMLGAQPFVFDVDYSGTATSAYLYVQAFKDGILTKPYLEIGGCGFSKPILNPRLKIYVDILDSRTSVMKLTPQNKIEGDFFRFLSDVIFGNSEASGGSATVSTDQMEIGGMQTYGPVYRPDLSKELIPVGYIKSTKKGNISSDDAIPGDGRQLEAGCDYVVFYLKLNQQPAPGVTNGGH